MFILNRKRRVAEKGFTLIELLVVIAIIGVLATIVLASLQNARRKSRDAARIGHIKQIQLGLELYADSQASFAYPALLTDLQPTFMTQLPLDPLGGAYGYDVGAPATTYALRATLEETTHPAFSTDVDVVTGAGVVLACDDPSRFYCVQP